MPPFRNHIRPGDIISYIDEQTWMITERSSYKSRWKLAFVVAIEYKEIFTPGLTPYYIRKYETLVTTNGALSRLQFYLDEEEIAWTKIDLGV